MICMPKRSRIRRILEQTADQKQNSFGITKATADAAKRISLSQVQASSNEGANVARYGLVTPVSMSSVLLFPGEEVSGQQYGFDGRPLPTDKNTQLITARNNATRASKPPLLTDGIVRPRTVPNYYESTSTSADDYIEIGGVRVAKSRPKNIALVPKVYIAMPMINII